jgi:O-antigen/teichoic acid export membrane protein
MLFGRGLSVLCQAAYLIVLARLLGNNEYGIYVGALATVSILSQYSSIGSSFVLLRYVSLDTDNFSRYWGNVLITTLIVGGFLTALLSWGVPHWAHSYTPLMVFCIAFGECFCTQLAVAAAQVFQSLEKLRITALLNLIVNLLRVALSGFMLWHLHHATAQQWVIAALVVSIFAAVMAVATVTISCGMPRFSLQILSQRSGEGLVYCSAANGVIFLRKFACFLWRMARWPVENLQRFCNRCRRHFFLKRRASQFSC